MKVLKLAGNKVALIVKLWGPFITEHFMQVHLNALDAMTIFSIQWSAGHRIQDDKGIQCKAAGGGHNASIMDREIEFSKSSGAGSKKVRNIPSVEKYGRTALVTAFRRFTNQDQRCSIFIFHYALGLPDNGRGMMAQKVVIVQISPEFFGSFNIFTLHL